MLRTKKSLVCLFLSLLLASLALWAVPAFAAETEVKASGTCGADGDNLAWTLTYDGVLTVSGSGQMDQYYKTSLPVFGREKAPWYEYKTDITVVVIENGVTSIGENAFYNCYKIQTVQLPQSLNLVGDSAFDTDGTICEVYYMAPLGQFGSVAVKENNGRLLSARRHSHVSGGGTSSTQQQNLTQATCTAVGGYDMIERCQYCQLVLNITHQTIPRKSHTPGEAVIENEVAATCYSQGRYDRAVYCADCGGKLYCHRTDNGKRVDKFTCGNYPSKKCKSGHRIDGNDLLQAVGRTLKAVHDYIQVDNSQFIRTVEESLTSQQTQDVKTQKKRLAECQHRAQELETLLCKIYEDNILGKLPDKRYQMLSNQYERESTALEQEISELSESIASYTDGTSEAKKFMALINKYQDFENLTAAMLNELIDKIVVYERDRKGSIQTTQRVDIYFSFIGNFVPPAEPVDPEVAAAQEEERRKIEERKDRLHQNYLRRKANGSQQKWEEKYRPIREAKKAKQKAELDATSAKYTRSRYYDMRLVTRTEADMPEGMLGYDANEVVRKANAAKDEKEAVAI